MIWRLEEYTKKSKERVIAAASESNVNLKSNSKTTKSKKQNWKEKQLQVTN